MDLLKPFKVVKKKLADIKEEKQQEYEQQEKLRKWKEKLERAIEAHSDYRTKCAKWDAIYNGTDEVEGSNVKARQVVNLTFQIIESSIKTDVPLPRVDEISIDDKDAKEMVEGMLTYMAQGPELKRITSQNERIVKKNAQAVFKVSYNPDYDGHSFRGRVEVINPHPVNVIPQPNVFRVKDMDYLFHIENRTISQICRRYGEEFRELLENESAEYQDLDTFNEFNVQSTSEKGIVSVVECWYKDKDGDVCLLTWANDVILRDIPKFYYKRDEQGNIIDTEEVEIEEIDPITQQPVKKTVTVKCRVPKTFPFVIWYNIPREKNFYGKSDVEVIQGQQESIKKILSIQEEKLIKGTSKIFVREGLGLENKITNATLQVIPTPDPNSDIVVKDMKTPDNDYVQYYQFIQQAAKDTLGITNAYQGKADSATLSGKAIQALAQNAEGRLEVKQFEKEIAFTELYQLLYDFIVAFYDDEIPYRIEGSGSPKFGTFTKGKLIKQDKAGEWYYPEFDIYINADSGLARDKATILQNAVQLAQAKLLDPVELWTILEDIGYPSASLVLDMEKQKQEAAQQAQIQQGVNPLLAQKLQAEQQKMDFEAQKQQLQIEREKMKHDLEKNKLYEQGTPEMEAQLTEILKQLSPEELELFASLPHEQKMQMVQQLLENE